MLGTVFSLCVPRIGLQGNTTAPTPPATPALPSRTAMRPSASSSTCSGHRRRKQSPTPRHPRPTSSCAARSTIWPRQLVVVNGEKEEEQRRDRREGGGTTSGKNFTPTSALPSLVLHEAPPQAQQTHIPASPLCSSSSTHCARRLFPATGGEFPSDERAWILKCRQIHTVGPAPPTAASPPAKSSAATGAVVDKSYLTSSVAAKK
ncbi:uncharacterized protein [Triticum aestivum]|uniref:uncharacterized protein isoform X1 n=1 Tax=Triticum aestivum TaxID=4565 RepID=UPI001D016257|nr:uncharacterized protein LOC123052554 isoform X1 [Triticum aestivum]